ncbi:glycerophosphoryl diester phosphodiesterase [Gorgonomyces haynaldii]|nr:glycerophosphoryl diester phosphodiesterase [Gorgonomyces haynaldii]
MEDTQLSMHPILLLAHRGSPAYRPEHTIEGYKLAIEMGASIIEPDLVSTKDGHLVVRHENEISGTTNVAELPQFAGRKTTKAIDGKNVTGWFTEDFTLEEIKQLRARERIPDIRPKNVQYNDLYSIPTLQEVIKLVQNTNAQGRKLGMYPETKHPSYFQKLGLAMEDKLVNQLHDAGFKTPCSLVFIQSFEVANLKYMRNLTKLPLVQLIDSTGNRPYDFVLSGDPRKYDDLVTPEGLKEIATYADVVGPYKEWIIPRVNNDLGQPTDLVKNAHAVGLKVHTWTMRPENQFLPNALRSSTNVTEIGNSVAEIQAYLRAGIDGFFSDASDVGRKAIDTL